MNETFDGTEDIIDLREVVKRIEELENKPIKDSEFRELVGLLAEAHQSGMTGFQWRGQWYPWEVLGRNQLSDADLPYYMPVRFKGREYWALMK